MGEIEEDRPVCQMQFEEQVKEKVDEDGVRWKKLYVGSGEHLQNWLSQIIEINGEENVKLEEVKPKTLKCFEESEIKTFRIWVKDKHK